MVLYIVDDEKKIRESLHQYIQWSSLGITDVFTVGNGIDALEQMTKYPPHILLTDVRMPKMDGIELSRRVRESYPNCIIIFLSGYSDKEYLLSAIDVKAIQYIEKPANVDVIKSTIKSAVTQCREQLLLLENMNHLQTFYDDNLSLYRQELLLQLISSQSVSKELQNELLQQEIEIYKQPQYTLIHIRMNWPIHIISSEQSVMIRKILQLVNSTSWSSNLLAGFDSSHHLVILLAQSFTEKNKNLITALLEDICHQFLPELSYSIGISTSYSKLEYSNTAYLAAVELSAMQFYFGLNQILTSDIPINTYDVDSIFRDYTVYKQALYENNFELASSEMLRCRKILIDKKPSPFIAKAIYKKFILLMQEVAEKAELEAFLNSTKLNESFTFIDRGNTVGSVHQYGLDLLSHYFDMIEKNAKYSTRIIDIMRFIEKHIADNQLSIHFIADRFNLSHAYLCSYFKKATQQTVNQYITELRIQKAKELLDSTNLKVYEIAQELGLNDTNYFSSFFHKHVGLTPLEYKDKLYQERQNK